MLYLFLTFFNEILKCWETNLLMIFEKLENVKALMSNKLIKAHLNLNSKLTLKLH